MKNLRKTLPFIFVITISQTALSQQPIVANAGEATPDKIIPIKIQTTEATPEEKQEADEASFTLAGSIDTYFHSVLGARNSFYGDADAPSTSFGDLKGFSLGMLNLIASYGGDKAGFTGDLVFGPRGRAAVFGTATGQAIINQMFGWYKLGNVVTLNMGQFNTFLGYEVISPTVNFHYSTSYMFSWGPFNHTGLRADFDLGGGLGAKLAIMNPTDIVEFNPVDTYTFGGQLGYTTDKGGVWLNLLYGDQDGTLSSDDFAGSPVSSAGNLFQADITGGWDLSETFYLGINTTLQSVASGETFDTSGEVQEVGGDAATFMGVALYPKITLSESFALGLRGEYFSVTNGHLGIIGMDANGDGSVMEFTLSGNYKVGGLTFIPEFRIDTTSEDSFVDADGAATNMMPSLNLAAVYKF
jgi:hypothetical protein